MKQTKYWEILLFSIPIAAILMFAFLYDILTRAFNSLVNFDFKGAITLCGGGFFVFGFVFMVISVFIYGVRLNQN